MADSFEFDFSELNKLAADIAAVPEKAGPNIVKAIHVTSNKVMKGWRDRLRGSATLPALPYALSYEVSSTAGLELSTIESEIGFQKGRKQAAFGHISEFGSINNPPRGFGLASLQEQLDDFEAGLAKAIEPDL